MMHAHASWQDFLERAHNLLDPQYREFLQNGTYLPGPQRLFQAFRTLPKPRVRYLLFGQDPYPRPESATGYAFIDGRVEEIFSPVGLSKAVNRATSLRNFIKMALVCEGLLGEDRSQSAIAVVPKTGLIRTVDALRENFENNGVMLLNTSLVFTDKKSAKMHAKAWKPFMGAVLDALPQDVTLILFGAIAAQIRKLPASKRFESVEIEHPYNLSFIDNQEAQSLFGPMQLLQSS